MGGCRATKAQVIVSAIDALPGDRDTRTRGMQAMLDSAKGLDATELRRVGRRLVETVDPDGRARREERELDREERAAPESQPLDHVRRSRWLLDQWLLLSRRRCRPPHHLAPAGETPTCCGGGLQPHLL